MLQAALQLSDARVGQVISTRSNMFCWERLHAGAMHCTDSVHALSVCDSVDYIGPGY